MIPNANLIGPLTEAELCDQFAAIRDTMSTDSRWRVMRWWHRRKANQLRMQADVWRGLEWRMLKSIDAAMKKPADPCQGWVGPDVDCDHEAVATVRCGELADAGILQPDWRACAEHAKKADRVTFTVEGREVGGLVEYDPVPEAVVPMAGGRIFEVELPGSEGDA